MKYRFCLLTASWLAGAAAAAPPEATIQPSAPIAQPAAESTSPAPMTLRDRIRNFFTGRQGDRKDEVIQAPMPTLGPPTQKTVFQPGTAVSKTGTAVSQPGVPTLQPGTTPPHTGMELTAKDLEKVGHENDYSWITGKLFRASGDSRWVLRYGAPYEVDRYEGAVMLSGGGPELAACRAGDLLCVRGKVLNSLRSTKPHAGALYQVNELHVIEHSAR